MICLMKRPPSLFRELLWKETRCLRTDAIISFTYDPLGNNTSCADGDKLNPVATLINEMNDFAEGVPATDKVCQQILDKTEE